MTCSTHINICSHHTGRVHEDMACLQLRTERQPEGRGIFNYVHGTSMTKVPSYAQSSGFEATPQSSHWNLPTSSETRLQPRSITCVTGRHIPVALAIKPDASPPSRAARRSVGRAILVVVPVSWIWWVTAHGYGVEIRGKKKQCRSS